MHKHFNFDDELLENLSSQSFLNWKVGNFSQDNKPDQADHIQNLALGEENPIDLSSQCMASTQNEFYLIYSFSDYRDGESTITLALFRKNDGVSLQRSLPPMHFNIKSLSFMESRSQFLYLLQGTECGNICVTEFNHHQLSVNTKILKISKCCIVQIVPSHVDHCAFAVDSNGTVYFFNWKSSRIIIEMLSIPMPMQNSNHLLIDHEEGIVAIAFSYGKIEVWDLKQSINSYKLHTQKSDYSRSDRQATIDPISEDLSSLNSAGLKRKKDNFHHKIFKIKPRMILTECVSKGILWADFVGEFIAIINLFGVLEIIAASFNNFSQFHQNYLVISKFQILEKEKQEKYKINEKKFISKQNESKNIFHVQKFIKKNVENVEFLVGINFFQPENGNSICFSCIDKIALNSEYKLEKHFRIHLETISNLMEFKASEEKEFILARSTEKCIIALWAD